MAPEDLSALVVSLKVALGASLIAMLLGAPVGYALSQVRRRPGAGLWSGLGLEFLLHLPVIAPPVVVGLVLLSTLGGAAPLGSWLEQNFHIQLAFTTAGAALAAGIVAAPFAARAASLSFEGVDSTLQEAAHASGAGRLDTFVNVTLPLAAPGLIAGLLTAFAVALGEFGAVITFAANIPGQTQTLPLAIYAALAAPGGEERAAHLALMAVSMAGLAVLAAQLLRARAQRGFGP